MEECSYLPDFYIPSIDRWFEIKGQPLTVSEVQKCEQFCRRKDNENIKFSILIGAPKPLMLEEENFSSALTESRSQTGPRRLGTATRISASLSRRLSAFFGSTHDQAPKAAKFAVLNPGHAGFPKRVERSEGSNSAPIRNAPCFAVCAVVCDPLSRAECVHAFARESKRGPFAREVEKCNEKRLGDKIYDSSFA